jgi:imidazolonepropionase-like amidohydrolase
MSLAGIPNAVLIKMATHDAAEWLGVLDESGTIEKGKRADLIILNKNPLQGISNTLEIDNVIFKGNLLVRDSLLIKK